MADYYKNDMGSYSINYNDQKFQDLKNEQNQKESEISQNYNNIINNSDKNYQNQINATNDYAKTQTELQQAQTNQQIQQIQQQEQNSQQDYTKEQMGSYADYMKQTKSNAQTMANSGLSNTGYSESSLVSMYNQYQSRVATAKDTLSKTMMNFGNQIQQAQISNNQTIADIAYKALQTQNTLNQQSFEYKNSMILDKEKSLQQLNDDYYARNQGVIANINSEIDLQVKLDQIDAEYDQWLKEFNQKQAQYDEENRQWWANYNNSNAHWEREFALKKQESRAQTNYNNAQAAKLKANRNPYQSTSYDQELKAEAISDRTRNSLDAVLKNQGVDYLKEVVNNMYQDGTITQRQLKTIAEDYNL